MNKNVKRVLTVAVVIGLAATLLFINTRPVSADVIIAEKGDVETWFLEEGKAGAIDDFQIYSQVSGKVGQVYVEKDQYVEAGTIIARIDPADYLSEIAIRQSSIRSYHAQSQTTDLELSIENMQLELDYSKEQLDIYTALYDEGAVSKEIYDSYRQSYDSLAATMAKLQSQRSSSSGSYAGMIDAEKNAIAILENSVADCTIVAPQSGYITALPISSMSSVYPQTLLCTIKGRQGLVIESYVATADVVHLAVGDQVELIQKTREDDLLYTGTITEIAQWADEQVSALGIIEYKVKVTIRPDTEITTAHSGYNFDIRFFTFRGGDCIVLPSSAFYRSGGLDYVLVAVTNEHGDESGRVKAVSVSKGPSSNSEAVVLSGIEAGDIVIKNASSADISEGTKIKW